LAAKLRDEMKTMRFTTTIAVFLTLGMATFAYATGQTSAKSASIVLHAGFTPGEVLRYELEGSASFLPQPDVEGATVMTPRSPCDYALAAIVTLRPQPADKDGNTPVEAAYSEVRLTSARCAPLSATDFQKRLASMQSSSVMFRVGPHGETGLIDFRRKHFDYWNGADLLRKLTLDLLQTQFSSQAVAPGDTWKPRGQFAYPRDYALRQLDLSAATLQFKELVSIAAKPCAWIASKYVFLPLDIAASTTTREGRVLQGGNNAVAAVVDISLLLDTTTHHIGWLHRSQTIDNRLTLASQDDPDDPPADDPAPETSDPDQPDLNPETDHVVPDVVINRPDSRHPFMSFHFQEEARARLLPPERSVEWMAALLRFEQTPEPETRKTATKAGVAEPIAQAAKPAILKKTTRVVDSDSVLPTPAGFTRFEKALCQDQWFCAAVSVALPGKVEIADDTALRSVYLAKKDELVVSVAVGPALDRRDRGLSEEEELAKQATYYLSNYVWMAVKPGIGTSSSPATLDGYPASITTFTATRRDLADMRGVLGLIITPWGKVVPISCTPDDASALEQQTLCEQIITSVSLRR
jgi:hypothetical protein